MKRRRLAAAFGLALLVTVALSGCTPIAACAGPAAFPPSFWVDGTAWVKAHPGDAAVLCVLPSDPKREWSCQHVYAHGLRVQLVPTADARTLTPKTPFTITVAVRQDGVQGPPASFSEHLTSNGFDAQKRAKDYCGPGVQWLEKLTLNADGTLTDDGYGAL